jgi:hypothetical protein
MYASHAENKLAVSLGYTVTISPETGTSFERLWDDKKVGGRYEVYFDTESDKTYYRDRDKPTDKWVCSKGVRRVWATQTGWATADVIEGSYCNHKPYGTDELEQALRRFLEED